jgi:hypothetical protein
MNLLGTGIFDNKIDGMSCSSVEEQDAGDGGMLCTYDRHDMKI